MFTGVSVAGTMTSLIAPGGRLVVDVGAQLEDCVQADFLCLTHGHVDHIGMIEWVLNARAMRKMPPQKILAEAPVLEHIQDLIKLRQRFDRWLPGFVPVEVTPGMEVDGPSGKKIRVFRSTHVTPTVGFIVGDRRKKLKAEFVGLPEKQLAKLGRSGVQLQESVFVGELAYTGDTTEDIFAESPEIASVQTLAIECTYTQPDKLEKAKPRGHMHADQLLSKLKEINFSNRVQLVHFSVSVKTEDRIATVQKFLSEGINTVTLDSAIDQAAQAGLSKP